MLVCQFWALICPFAQTKLFLKDHYHFHVLIGPFDCAKLQKKFLRTKLAQGMVLEYIGNIDGSVDLLKMKCLKPKCGSDNIIDNTPKHLPEDIGDFIFWNIIAGPLVVALKCSTQIEVKNNNKYVEIVNQVKKMDQKSLWL